MNSFSVYNTQESLIILYEDNHIVVVNKKSSEIVQSDKTGDKSIIEFVKDYIEEGTEDDIICFENIYPLFQKWYEQTIDNKVPDQKDFVQIVREILCKKSKLDTLPSSFVVGYKLHKMVRN